MVNQQTCQKCRQGTDELGVQTVPTSPERSNGSSGQGKEVGIIGSQSQSHLSTDDGGKSSLQKSLLAIIHIKNQRIPIHFRKHQCLIECPIGYEGDQCQSGDPQPLFPMGLISPGWICFLSGSHSPRKNQTKSHHTQPDKNQCPATEQVKDGENFSCQHPETPAITDSQDSHHPSGNAWNPAAHINPARHGCQCKEYYRAQERQKNFAFKIEGDSATEERR